MQDAHILDGNLVRINEQAVADGHRIVAVAAEDSQTGERQLTLRRLRKRGATITLISENSDQGQYPPIVIDACREQGAISG